MTGITHNASSKPLGQLGLLRDTISSYVCSRGFKTICPGELQKNPYKNQGPKIEARAWLLLLANS